MTNIFGIVESVFYSLVLAYGIYLSIRYLTMFERLLKSMEFAYEIRLVYCRIAYVSVFTMVLSTLFFNSVIKALRAKAVN